LTYKLGHLDNFAVTRLEVFVSQLHVAVDCWCRSNCRYCGRCVDVCSSHHCSTDCLLHLSAQVSRVYSCTFSELGLRLQMLLTLRFISL